MATLKAYGALQLVESQPITGKPNKSPPTKILVLRDGPVDIAGWEGVSLDRKQAKVMIAAFQKHGVDVPIDYEHSTVRLDRDGKARAAGWITGLAYVGGEGLWAEVTWNAEAREEIVSEEYKYFSPVVDFKVSPSGAKSMIRFDSLALTNKPASRDLGELMTASEIERIFNMATKRRKPKAQKKGKGVRELIEATLLAQEENDEEDEFPEVTADSKAIASLLSKLQELGSDLADNSSIASIVSAAIEHMGAEHPEDDEKEEAKAAEEAAKKAAAEAGLKAAGVKELATAVAGLQVKAAKYDEAIKELKGLKTERDDQRVASLIDKQIKLGKINPNDEKQLAAATTMARNDEESFEQLMGGLEASFPAEGKTGFDGPVPVVGTSGNRQKFIASAAGRFDKDPAVAMGATKRHWVDACLNCEDQPELNGAEVEALCGKAGK